MKCLLYGRRGINMFGIMLIGPRKGEKKGNEHLCRTCQMYDLFKVLQMGVQWANRDHMRSHCVEPKTPD